MVQRHFYKQSVSRSCLAAALAFGMAGAPAIAAAQARPTIPAPTPAADGSAPAATGPSDSMIGDIIVTAQKRSERLSDIGMSINAKTGDQLAQQGIRSIESFSKIDTSFTYGQTNSGTPTYTVRGVGYYDYSLAASPAVSIYSDEVPLPYSAMTKGAAMDLERVEILKGPQGTLFGQNATGGAINFIAAKPTATFKAGVEGTYARFGAVNLNGFISGPLSDTVRARLSVDADTGGAWQQSVSRDDVLGDRRSLKGRLLLEWTPTSALTVNLNLNGWRDRSDTQAGQLTGFVDPAAVAASLPALFAKPTTTQNARAADWGPGDPRADEGFYQGALRIGYDLAPSVQLTSITAYSDFRTRSTYDTDGTDLSNYKLGLDGHIQSFSQELRLSGKSLGSRLSWVVGGNYAHDKASDIQHVNVSEGLTSFAFTGFGAPRWDVVDNRALSRVSTVAGFFNLDYKISSTLSVHGGARYTDSVINFEGCTADPGDGLFAAGANALQAFLRQQAHIPVPTVPAGAGQCITLDANLVPGLVHSRLKEHNASWRVGIDWKPVRDVLLYATATKGYKAGAYPTQAAIFAQALRPVRQESLMAYEAGFKTSWFNHSLSLDGAYFHYDYNDKQINGSVDVPPIGVLFTLINIPKSVVDGFELTANWRALPGLQLSASATYLDSRVKGDFFNITRPGTVENFRGEAFPFSPKWAVHAGGAYDWSIAENLGAYVGADYSYKSATYDAFGEVDFERIKAYGLLDLRAGLRSKTAGWTAEVFGRNVTNAYYWNDATAPADATYRRAGMPVTYGVRLSQRF
ncbi:MAG: TonB dependent receptor [Bradyrhizobium sp.]|nr:TonB dependent receptor [Bradyrhizobium sp.]